MTAKPRFTYYTTPESPVSYGRLAECIWVATTLARDLRAPQQVCGATDPNGPPTLLYTITPHNQ